MKKPDQIIYIDSDEISLFLAETILSAFEWQNPMQFFTELEKAFDYISTLQPSRENNILVFVNVAILMGEHELIRQLKTRLLPFSPRFCLLSSMPEAKKREKEFIEEIGISCYIEKPLTEEKFIQALEMNH